MDLHGEMFIGGATERGSERGASAIDPATGETLTPDYPGATAAQLDRACALAEAAFEPYRALPPEARAAFLEAIADNIMGLGDALIERCMRESGLPRPRLEGERGRTCNQLRMFAGVVRDGGYLGARLDSAQPDRQPAPRPDLRLRNVPLGPVAVFGASNFPLAFSVAGGDTASALAAGCPVVAKAHSAHLGTSEMVGRAVQQAARDTGMPEGVFSLLFGSGATIGQGLVADPRIKAVGFTGSRSGGLALVATAQGRSEPIPVYAEMSSINPVLLMPHALEDGAERIAKGFVGALTLGAGQFCTNPGLIIAVEGPALDRFVAAAAEALSASPAATMLTPGIHKAYVDAVAAMSGHASVEQLGQGLSGEGYRGQAGLLGVDAETFVADHALQDEIFGATSLVVRCPDVATMARVVGALEGQLTAALHLVDADHDAARGLIAALERKVGRIIVNGFGTGVEVGHAMVHGGPFPATSDSRTTSVGSLAIARFLRPVSYQDLPDALLPDALRDANPLGLTRLMDGKVAVA